MTTQSYIQDLRNVLDGFEAANKAVVEAIDVALAQRQEEVERLTAAREQLLAKDTRPERKPRKQQSEGRSGQRHERLAKHAKERAERKRSGKVEHRGDRKAQILSMTEEGRTPKQIADELDTHVNYVYLVRRNAMQEAAVKPKRQGKQQRKAA